MNPNLDTHVWTGEVEIRGEDLNDIEARLTIEWSVDCGHYYRGDYKLQADFPTVKDGSLVTVDLTHLVHESVIDELMNTYIVSA